MVALIFMIFACSSGSGFEWKRHLRAKPFFRALAKMVDRELPIKVGLTGSIGMGKSTITNQLKKLGFPVFDADATVHKLYAVEGAAVEPLRKLCPESIVNGTVDRSKLMNNIMKDASLISQIESIVHPLVEKEKFAFYADCKSRHHPIIFYDIPLLFEVMLKRQQIKASDQCQFLSFDTIVTVTASATTQRCRVLERTGMSEEKFQAILLKQVPDEYKRRHSDYLIHTDFSGYGEGKSQLATIIDDLYQKNRVEVTNMLNELDGSNCTQGYSELNDRVHEPAGIIFTEDGMFDMEMVKLDMDNLFWNFIHAKMPSAFEKRECYPRILERISTNNPWLVYNNVEIQKLALQELCTPTEALYIDEALHIRMDAIKYIDNYITDTARSIMAQSAKRNLNIGLITSLDISCDLPCKMTTVLNHHNMGTNESSIVPYVVLSQMWRVSPRNLRIYTVSPNALQVARGLSIKLWEDEQRYEFQK